MQTTTWHPFHEVEKFFRENSLIFDLHSEKLLDKGTHDITEWSPSANITEVKKEYLVKIDLPDVGKEDIHVSVNDGILTIEGERKRGNEEEQEACHQVESFYGQFYRSFTLPGNVDESKIKADSKNGVLCVHLPKTEDLPVKKSVEIEVA